MSDLDKNKTNQKCLYYNWGGDGTGGRPYYPTAYGARCELNNQFFERKEGILEPNCYQCVKDIETLLRFIC